MDAGAARFSLDATQQRAQQGELFVLEPEAVHTGMAAVPEGWSYKVLYIEPGLLHRWAEHDQPAPQAARWVVFKDVALRAALARVHEALVAEPPGTGHRRADSVRARRAAPPPAARPRRTTP